LTAELANYGDISLNCTELGQIRIKLSHEITEKQ